MAARWLSPTRRACCRKSIEGSIRTFFSWCSISTEVRNRLSRGSSDKQVSHSHPTDGTPTDVPVPRKVIFIAFSKQRRTACADQPACSQTDDLLRPSDCPAFVLEEGRAGRSDVGRNQCRPAAALRRASELTRDASRSRRRACLQDQEKKLPAFERSQVPALDCKPVRPAYSQPMPRHPVGHSLEARLLRLAAVAA